MNRILQTFTCCSTLPSFLCCRLGDSGWIWTNEMWAELKADTTMPALKCICMHTSCHSCPVAGPGKANDEDGVTENTKSPEPSVTTGNNWTLKINLYTRKPLRFWCSLGPQQSLSIPNSDDDDQVCHGCSNICSSFCVLRKFIVYLGKQIMCLLTVGKV